MNIAIVSCFRNAASYSSRYCEQMVGLSQLLGKHAHKLHLILGYGDSTDGTDEVLFEQCFDRFACTLMDVSHGGAHYGSIVHPTRFKQLAWVYNTLWKALPEDVDVVGLVESDLIWDAETMVELVKQVGPYRVSAPMVMHKDGRFYDTFAFRRNGQNFKNENPFHPMFNLKVRHYNMTSVGSVFFMDARLARQLYWPEKDVVVGVCEQIRELGVNIVLDSYLKVVHP